MKLGKKVNLFQEGGAMAPQQQDPMLILLQGATQAVQSQDCQIAMQVCLMLVEMVNSSQPAAPTTTAEEPVYRNGGRLIRRIKY